MKLNSKRTFYVGLAFMSISAFWQVYDGIIPLILKYTFGIGDTWSGAVMALDNVLALFMLPLFGVLSDRTHTRIGRRMPFILAGTAGAVMCLVLIPLANQLKSLPLFFVGLGLVLICMATYRSPAVALMPDVTPKPLRSQGNAIINLMGAVGGIIMLAAVKFLVPAGDNPNYFPVFLCTAALMAVCVMLLFVKIKEPACVAQMKKESSEAGYDPADQDGTDAPGEGEKMNPAVFRSLVLILASVVLWFMGYNAVTTHFSKYARESWGMAGGNYAMVLMVAQAGAILTYIPVGMIAARVGRKRTIQIGCLLLAGSFGSAILFHSFSWMLFGFFALAGVAWAFINVNSYPMVVEMSRGADVGKYTGYYYTFSMSAQILTPILSGWLMEHVGYHTLFPYAALCVVGSFVTMCFVRHGDAKPVPVKNKLEAFDVDD
ncbi:MFS transporter [Allofournierella sp.]|uniref:MFS transporter n=1 Tax=Allofournierella sp. TaxID=1940256 RepID=UPI003AB81401